jgi:SPP1 family predicted phage head-tail adaptor
VGVSAGQRDATVTIQCLTEGAATSGFPTETFTDRECVAMHKRHISGDERFTADQVTARAITVWTMPYRDYMDPDLVDVAKKRRLVYRSRIYDIVEGILLCRGGNIQLRTLAKVG